MTTGCTCGTPGCGGLTYWPGDRCSRCQIEAMPRGTARTAREIMHRILDGCQAGVADLVGRGRDGREAGQ